MRRNTFHPAAFNPFVLWAEFAMKSSEMLVASSQVIGTRVGRMARAGAVPNARDRKEFTLMGTEKLKAGTESMLAVATRMNTGNVELASRAWRQWMGSMGAMATLAGSRNVGEAMARQQRLVRTLARSGRTQSLLSSDAARLASAALQPIHRAASANAKRLGRSKPRGPGAKR